MNWVGGKVALPFPCNPQTLFLDFIGTRRFAQRQIASKIAESTLSKVRLLELCR